MDEILTEIENANSPSSDHSTISNILIRLQNEINSQFLRPYSQSDNENFLSKFWAFILEVGSNPNTSIRISAYRTTITFLLKITPYYPSLIQKTFFASIRMIEINAKNVQIVIAAFSFISNFTPIPFLNHILENSDILQDFTLIDSTFSDHIGPIIKNLRRISKEWLNKLLFLFLEKGVKPQDRHLILAVTEIIKHDPIFFINELLKYIRDHSTVKENLSLLSYLFSTIKCNYESIDMKDLVEISVEILKNQQQSTANDIDSALQILSLDMAPFNITVSENDSDESENSEDETDENSNENKNKQKLFIQINSESYEHEFTICVSDFVVRPSFYLLPLPINLLEISPNDGVLQMTSKFKTMAKIVNRPDARHKVKIYIFDKFSSVLSKSYNDTTSACLQGFALCLPTFLEMTDASNILILTQQVIFGPQQSWFHMIDIVNIIKSIPYKYYNFSENKNIHKKSSYKFDERSIIDLLINFSMNSNEKLSKAAEKTIANIVNYTDFIQGTYYITEKVDFFNITSLHRFLSILLTLFKKRRKSKKKEKITRRYNKHETKHLQYFILRLIEIRSIYDYDIQLFEQIMNFMSYFDLHFIERPILRDFSVDAESIIETSLFVIGGIQIDNGQISPEKKQNIFNYVSQEFASLNFESVPEMKMNYNNFLPAFSTAFRFLSALPRQCLLKRKNLVLNLFSWSMNLFQRRSARFAERYWKSNLDPKSNIDFLTTVQPTLEFIQDDETIALYCELYLSVVKKDDSNQSNEQLDSFFAALHTITRDEIDPNHYIPEFYALEIYASKEKDELPSMRNKVTQLNKDQQLSLYQFLRLFENNLKLIGKINESTFDKISDEIQKIKEEEEEQQKKNDEIKEKDTKVKFDQTQVNNVSLSNDDNTNSSNENQNELKKEETSSTDSIESVDTSKRKRKKNEQKDSDQSRFRRKSEKPRSMTNTAITPSMTFNSLEGTSIPELSQGDLVKRGNQPRKRASTRRSSSVEPVKKTNNKKGKEDSKKVTKSEEENNINDDDEYDFFNDSSFLNDEDEDEESTKNNQNAFQQKDQEDEDQHQQDHEEEKVDFHQITNDYLSTNLIDENISNALIKTQLKLSTFTFSKDHIEKLIRYYINENDKSGIEILLNYSSSHSIEISILNYLLPSEVIPTALNYLKTVSSSELDDFIEKLKNQPQTAEIKHAIFALNPSKNFNEIITSPHITKSDIKDFTMSVDLCNHKELVELVIRLMKEAKSKKRLDYVLTMANVIFSFVTVTKGEIDSIMQIVAEKDKIIPGLPLSQLVLTLASKIESNDEFVRFVKNCYSKCQGKSSGLLSLHQALIASPNSKASENLSNVTGPYIISVIPSVYCAGVRFIHQALISLSESDCIPLLKANLAKLLKNFESKRDMFPIAKVTGEPFTFMLSRDSLHTFQMELINHASEIIPCNKKASFEGLSLCLPRFIDFFNEAPIEVVKNMETKCDQLLTKPANMSTFKIYMMSLRERVEKSIKSRAKDDIVSDFITQWLSECKDYDCYYMADIIYEWENFIFQCYGLEQLLNYVCYMFHKYIPRFFPLYIAMSRFIRKNYKAGSDDDRELIRRYLENSAMLNQVRAHSLSTLLIMEFEFSKEALQLAAYPDDCEESNKLIDSNNHFVELLNKIKSYV